jgi:hypothetical protein
MMTRSSVIAAIILSFALGGMAWTERASAASDQPAAAAPPPAMSAADKAAISKSCTDQANAKKLHGTPRKKFRAACKKAGGKTE